jgi:tetratricopeptide (TPR) repeat protein
MNPQAYRHLGMAKAQKHLYMDAISDLKKAIELSSASNEAVAELGYVFAVSGREDEARSLLRQLMRPANAHVSQYHLAIIYAGLRETDKALECLERAVKDRSPGIVHLKVSPLFLELRSIARFQQLLRKMGL